MDEIAGETPIERVFRLAGGQARVARALNVSPQAVNKWARRVPAERVLALSGITDGRVRPSELRPDLYPPETPAAVRPEG